MRTLKLIAVAAVVVWSYSILAQQADANVHQSATASAQATEVNHSAGANASASQRGAQVNGQSSASGAGAVNGIGSSNGTASGSASGGAEMRSVNGELVGKLDSKTAKVGDPVVVKTTEKTQTADGVVIPKGTKLIGHVTDVQAHSKSNQESHMAIQFDRAELKGGQSMAIHSVIQSVSPASHAATMASADDDAMFGAPAMGGGARGGGMVGGGARGGGAARGGLLGGGGLAGATAHTAGSVAGGAGSELGSAANGAVGATGNTAGNLTGSATRGATGLSGAASGRSLVETHPTGIPGLMLAGDATGASSGMFSANRGNVHLDGGTNMVLGVSSVARK